MKEFAQVRAMSIKKNDEIIVVIKLSLKYLNGEQPMNDCISLQNVL